jgi:ABC-2 type transport system permease protein
VILAAFLRRDWLVARAYKLPFALAVLQLLLSLTLIYFLARIVDDSRVAAETGELESGYFGFVLIGFSTLTIVEVALLAFSRRIRGDQTKGVLEAVMAAPLATWVLLLGGAAYEILFGVAIGLLQVVLAVILFDFRPEVELAGAAAIVLVYPALLAVFGAAGILIAAFTVVYKDPSSLVGLGSAALAVLTGVWFPVSVLPGALEFLSELIPLTWANVVLRQAFGGADIDWVRVAGLVGVAAVALPLAVAAFAAAADRARRDGSLSQY